MNDFQQIMIYCNILWLGNSTSDWVTFNANNGCFSSVKKYRESVFYNDRQYYDQQYYDQQYYDYYDWQYYDYYDRQYYYWQYNKRDAYIW